MRVPGEYVGRLKSFRNKLQRNVPISKTQKKEKLSDEPIEVYVLGLLMERNTLYRAKQILKRISEEMVDYNELRVTPLSELTALFSEYTSEPEASAREIIRSLNALMDKFDTLDLKFLREYSKAELKKEFSDIKEAQPHGLDFLQMVSFDLSVLPLSNPMVELLRKAGALPENIDYSSAKSFLERHIKSSEYKNFYWQLRKATEMGGKEFILKRRRRKK